MSVNELQTTNEVQYEYVTFIKVDDNKIINEDAIKWVKKIDECLYICTKSVGCGSGKDETHKLCKITNSTSYTKLNNHFMY